MAELDVYGLGTYLPPVNSAASLIKAAGGNVDDHISWPNVCIASDEDQPSTMAARAVRAALTDAGVSPDELALVISTGISRDYVPSWSMAAEVMKLLGMGTDGFPFDMTVGCAGMVAGLEVARGWLQARGRGYAVIFSSERWSHTVDRSNSDTRALWGHADGAGAMVVGIGMPGARARYLGGTFSSQPKLNGYILVKHGGTVSPVAPPGESQFARTYQHERRPEARAAYEEGYARALGGISQRFGQPSHLVCNQVSPHAVGLIAKTAGIDDGAAVRTGLDYGHLGSADVVAGLSKLRQSAEFEGRIAMVGSTPYAFCAGMLEAL